MSDSAPHPEAVPHAEAAPAALPSTPLPVAQGGRREGVIPFAAARPPVPPPQEAGFFSGLALDEPGARARSIPILGGLAAVFGVAALFNTPIVLGPLGLAFGVAALFRRQVSLGVIGGVAGLVALLISPVFWALLGLGWLAGWLLG